MTAYGRVDTSLHSFLILALDGGRWSSSYPCRTILIPKEKNVVFVPEPFSSLREREISCPFRKLRQDFSVVHTLP